MSQDVCVKGLLLCERLSTLSTLVRSHSRVDPLMANDLARFAELFAAELAAQFKCISRHRTFPLLDQLKAGFELFVPQKMLLVSLRGVTDLVASLADESSPPWLTLVSATNCFPFPSLVLSALVLLKLPLCSKLLTTLRMKYELYFPPKPVQSFKDIIT